ncbi:hypothetical protein U91I_02143 [alpha proteobacterium U9-1i]|nr:hypothetical protein U91I_02143 [alpha proteobacterium U9-1i]
MCSTFHAAWSAYEKPLQAAPWRGFFMLRCPKTSVCRTPPRARIHPLVAICDGRRLLGE